MRKVFTIIAALILVVVIGAGIAQQINSRNVVGPQGGQSTEDAQAQLGANPPGCVAVQVLAAPGTWESRADDDPHNPTANPNSLLLHVTRPLQERFSAEQVDVWTLPYTAQFRNINAMHEMSYDDSRNEGFATLSAEIARMHAACPATRFVLIGFSQGAVLTGDLAHEIAQGRGPVSPDLVLGVSLIADGRMEHARGQFVGPANLAGVGAEIALEPANALVQAVTPGATMRGARSQGYGSLQDRVFNICARGDLVCDAPQGVGNALARAHEMVSGNVVHTQYATNMDVVEGQTVPQWVVSWVEGLIAGLI